MNLSFVTIVQFVGVTSFWGLLDLPLTEEACFCGVIRHVELITVSDESATLDTSPVIDLLADEFFANVSVSDGG